MKLSQKQTNQMTACIQLMLCGILAVLAFQREIRIGYKAGSKLKKRRLNKERGKGTAV